MHANSPETQPTSEERHLGPFDLHGTSVELRNVWFKYSHRTIFENFSLSVSTRICLLRGASGSAKSTLLKLIAGFVQPDAGSISSSAKKPYLICQDDGLLPWLTGLANIQKFTSTPLEELKSHPLFDRVGEFIQRPAGEYSFGQRRLVELFRSLVFGADLLLLDEPFNYVDEKARKLLTECLNVASQNGVRLWISSHYKEDFFGFEGTQLSLDGQIPVRQVKSEQVSYQ